MKFFIDTANVEDIRKANDMGVICGVTTNPSLIAKEGRDYAETLKEIATIVYGPISGEVKATTTDAEDMIAEGRVPLGKLITHHATLDQLPWALEMCHRHLDECIKFIIYPENKTGEKLVYELPENY